MAMTRRTTVRSRALSALVALGTIAFLFATPLMACAMETAALAVSEAECCRQMHGDCHDQVGPASHQCCRTVAGVPDAFAPHKTSSIDLDQVAVLPAPIAVHTERPAEASSLTSDRSPPTSPPRCSSVLRI